MSQSSDFPKPLPVVSIPVIGIIKGLADGMQAWCIVSGNRPDIDALVDRVKAGNASLGDVDETKYAILRRGYGDGPTQTDLKELREEGYNIIIDPIPPTQGSASTRSV